MDADSLFLFQPLCQCGVGFIGEVGKVESFHEYVTAVAEIFLMLPVTIIIGVALSANSLMVDGKVVWLYTHGSSLGQQPATKPP